MRYCKLLENVTLENSANTMSVVVVRIVYLYITRVPGAGALRSRVSPMAVTRGPGGRLRKVPAKGTPSGPQGIPKMIPKSSQEPPTWLSEGFPKAFLPRCRQKSGFRMPWNYENDALAHTRAQKSFCVGTRKLTQKASKMEAR